MRSIAMAHAFYGDVPDSRAARTAGRLAQDDSFDDTDAENVRPLIEAIDRALRATGYPALRAIEVDACRGVVGLCGRVPSYYQKQLAQATVQRVAGVRVVDNGIEVICGR
jgi:osmotically-inducible protein OsmY